MGATSFPDSVADLVCSMNTSVARDVLMSLNPTVHFESGDVNRLPLFPVESAEVIYANLDESFTQHESHRETSVEFKHPGPSTWRYAQAWAQQAVDREKGAPLPPWEPEIDPEPPIDHLSHALGLALGRFDAEGIAKTPPDSALPHGLLFLSTVAHDSALEEHPACAPLRQAWRTHAHAIDPKRPLDTYLRERFFQDDHRKRYEDRPIHLPLSSRNRGFVAWINIHRVHKNTLAALLSDHLRPALATLDGELEDVRRAAREGDKQTAASASRREDELIDARAELAQFLADVRQIQECGPPPAKPGDPPREVDAPWDLHLDDGVMIHAAVLWPLLEPQKWTKPRAWWSELCRAKGRKDYDWSRAAARYFPERTARKCEDDPSLAVAHGRFWELHPAKALAWELRLQDEIGEDFLLDEKRADVYRAAFLENHPDEAAEIRAAEQKRRERKRRKEEKAAAEAELVKRSEKGREDEAWHLSRAKEEGA